MQAARAAGTNAERLVKDAALQFIDDANFRAAVLEAKAFADRGEFIEEDGMDARFEDMLRSLCAFDGRPPRPRTCKASAITLKSTIPVIGSRPCASCRREFAERGKSVFCGTRIGLTRLRRHQRADYSDFKEPDGVGRVVCMKDTASIEWIAWGEVVLRWGMGEKMIFSVG